MKDINKIHNRDIFSESVKNKLENYPMPLDESVWKGIEKQLASKKSRVVPFWFWLSGGVAASLLVIFLLNPFKNSDNQLSDNQSIRINKTESPKELITARQINLSSDKEKTKGNAASAVKNTIQNIKLNNTHSKSQTNSLNPQIVKTEAEITNSSIQSSTEFQAKEAVLELTNSDLQVKDSIPAKKNDTKLASLPEMPELLELPSEKPKGRKTNKWLLCANVGTSANTNFDLSKGDSYQRVPQLTADRAYGASLNNLVEESNAYILEPNDFSDVIYLNPISVGFSVQKGLTSNLSVSSGLVYTYLRSNYRSNSQWQNANASLELHYLGVPLNLNIIIADNRHWNYYFSVGGMIEKGLRSVYKQTLKYQDTEQNTNVYSKIEGMQTSANAAFGVGYKLQKSWSLFFEPKLTYYFDNGQPISARTETPVNVGFNGGLRLGF